MKLLIERAIRLGRARAEAVADALAEAARDELPEEVVATRTDDGVTLIGRGLRLRSIVDARLRGFAGWLR